MQVPHHVFREYDIRGVAERDLTTPLAEALGQGFGTMVGASQGRARVAVARDCRLSSPRLHAALVEGLMASGCQVIDVGVGPSPLLYFAAHHLRTDGAVMVTGSHNPPDENGFKMMRGLAPFFGPDIVGLRETVEAGRFTAGSGSVREKGIDDDYVAALKAGARLGGPLPFTIVIDAGNGAGGPLAKRAFAECGVEAEYLYCEMDGRFPNHHPDPTQPENLRALVERVRATGARAGLAFDGDADRLGVVDERGEVLWGDRLLMLFARRLLRERPGAAVIGEVKCSQVLYDDVRARGGRPILWKTGHSLIKTKMKEEGALLAGEMSGHLFFADRWFGFDDAIYAGLRFVELLAEEGKSPSELLADVPATSVTPELRVPCPDALKFRAVEAMLRRYGATHEVVDVDGARILFGGGAWGLVRASNTQPVLVLRFEAESDARRDQLRAEVEAALAEELARLA